MTEQIVLPNVRKLFIPDPGYVMFEGDLKGADAQVVAWEAEDEDLKAAFRAGVDIHVKNAEDMWGTEFTKLPEGSHARDAKRQECKHTVHGVDYGCTPRTTAIQRGWTIYEAERFHKRWFMLHPGIRRYQERVKGDLAKNRTVSNKFGFSRIFFDRIDNCFTEALAWIPQSTVALNTYHGIFQLEERYPNVETLLQVHDSALWQCQTTQLPSLVEVREVLAVTIPYDDPLVIPWDLKRGTKSWGELEKWQ